MRLSPEIAEAKHKAEAYTVRPGRWGRVNVWRFRSWDSPEPGWRIVAEKYDRDGAEAEILDRLGLLPPEEPKPNPPQEIVLWFDWSGF